MTHKLLLFALLFQASLLTAQREYLNATVTTNDGVKLAGKIAVENWLKTPNKIEFRIENGASKNYGIADLAGIEVTRTDGFKLYFIRKTVELEVSPANIKELDFKPDLVYQRETVWLELLYQGAWTLYGLTDSGNKRHYLLETNNQQPVELVIKPWLKGNKTAGRLESVDLYKKQLSDLGNDCLQVLKMVREGDIAEKSNLELDQSALINICKAYDACKGTQSKYGLKREKTKWQGHVSAGAHYTQFDFNALPEGRTMSGLSGWQFAFAVRKFIGKSNKRLSFDAEAMILSEKLNDTKTGIGSVGLTSIFDYKTTELGLSTLAAYRISKAALRPTIKLGLTNRLKLSKNFTNQRGLPNQNPITLTDYSSSIYWHEIGPSIGLSCQYHRLGLEFRHIRTRYINGDLSGNKPTSRFYGLSLFYQIF
jgi:hypothetical protein